MYHTLSKDSWPHKRLLFLSLSLILILITDANVFFKNNGSHSENTASV